MPGRKQYTSVKTLRQRKVPNISATRYKHFWQLIRPLAGPLSYGSLATWLLLYPFCLRIVFRFLGFSADLWLF